MNNIIIFLIIYIGIGIGILIKMFLNEWNNINKLEKIIGIILFIYIPIMCYVLIMGLWTGDFIH